MPKKATVIKKRVFLLEDHRVLREGLRLFIEQEPDMEVCGEANNATEALSAITKLRPDAVVSDISLPGMNGIEFLKNLKVLHPEIVAVVLSMHDESIYAERALRAGALGYIMKKEGTDQVVIALRKAFKGERHISGNIVGAILHKALGSLRPGKSAPASPVELLSDRELEILEHIGRGENTKGIADVLRLSPKTVETHRVHIKEKLGITSVMELTQYAALWVEHESAGD